MQIGLITTLNTNIGDDFIREGICLLVQEIFKHSQISFVAVNKHAPLTIYPEWHPAHLAKHTHYLPRGRIRLKNFIEHWAPKLGHSAFDSCDVIIQCGAPVLWHRCHRCEWAEPLWYKLIGRLYRRIPVLNLAAGSCYSWEQQPTAITNVDDEHYLRTIMSYCRVTTVRDTLAQHLCKHLGTQTPLIPCSAFLAAQKHVAPLVESSMILVNYMPGGGHFDWNQKIDASAWFKTIQKLLTRLKRRHKVAFLCHSEREFSLVRELDETLPRIWPKTMQEYFQVVFSAKVALCNRMHASTVLAGMGIPSIAVGTDTRLLMVKALELPCFYIKEAGSCLLEEDLEVLIENRLHHQEKLLSLRAQTWKYYIEVITDALNQAS